MSPEPLSGEILSYVKSLGFSVARQGAKQSLAKIGGSQAPIILDLAKSLTRGNLRATDMFDYILLKEGNSKLPRGIHFNNPSACILDKKQDPRSPKISSLENSHCYSTREITYKGDDTTTHVGLMGTTNGKVGITAGFEKKTPNSSFNVDVVCPSLPPKDCYLGAEFKLNFW